MPSCARCGAPLTDRTAFCGTCGALIDRPNTADQLDAGSPAGPQPAAERPSPIPAQAAFNPAAKAYAAPARLEFGDVGVYIVRRFLALVVDLAGVGLLIGMCIVAYVDATRPAPDQFLANHARDFGIVLGIAILAYLTVAEALFGSTLGKGLFGLGVGRLDGGRLGLARAAVRNVLLPLDLAVIGFFVATVTIARRRIGDLVAGSVVTNARTGRWATVTAVLIATAAAWLLSANVDGTRISSQLFTLAGIQLPLYPAKPAPSPEATTSPIPPHPLATPTGQIRPHPSPSADPGRPQPPI
ncbi:MAG TPA: RDD family protein [Candidatus Eremiobacteraceae bacterium]|nr:RDD family protein [Candidatus Eremiobacteraceae bacterium]